ncbi:hypothetical protein [Leptothermofonsia sp. ETS-13]|uniref:hypothetical protein n=1 Tax=Leptothermofonsia sp. ETS-13 TaxID=3035696 RepID=UPI003B9E2FA9
MVLLYPQSFKPFQPPPESDKKPEPSKLPPVPLDDKIQEPDHSKESAETIHNLRQTYYLTWYLERRTFL